jgi:hypothetical protein
MNSHMQLIVDRLGEIVQLCPLDSITVLCATNITRHIWLGPTVVRSLVVLC